MKYRITVISDIHHNDGALERILSIINSGDYLVFCGDGVGEIMDIRGSITVPMVCVKGNNDFFYDMDDKACVELCGTRAIVTHGHRYGVRQGIDGLVALAESNNCTLVFYGHTHVYLDKKRNGVHVINPGALKNGSYALVTFDGERWTSEQLYI